MNVRHALLGLLIVIVCALIALTAQNAFTPARYLAGPLPMVPIQAVGGGEVFLEVRVSEAGRVDEVTALRVTPPFTAPLIAAVKQWQFRPAEEEQRRVRSRVLVAGLFRPPTLNTPTLGALPVDVAEGSAEIPRPAAAAVAPLHPPEALFGGIVLVEVEINAAGVVTKTAVLRSAPPFDGPAVAAARQWAFRPALRQRRPVASVAYIVFGFQQPVTTPRRR